MSGENDLRAFERERAAEYARKIGEGRPIEERRERALRLAQDAPTRRNVKGRLT
jgi:hypothetical protein